MDAITDPSITNITVKKSARIGWTKILNHTIGYYMQHDPCPILLVQPTIEDAKGYSTDEIEPMLRDTAILKGLVEDKRHRDTKNKILSKGFPGGRLHLIGADSPRGFRRITTRVNLYDEVDGWRVSTTEGDQLTLAKRRTDTFWNRKILAGSTPTIKDHSRIDGLFEKSDQRFYFVPCPHCDHGQVLKWGNKDTDYGFKWEKGKPESVYYLCEHCQGKIYHHHKKAMIELGEWKATREIKDHAGFHIWAAYSYSPNAAWEVLIHEWEEIMKHKRASEIQGFVNTVMGECFEEMNAVVLDDEKIMARREDYPAEVPMRACVLTAGVDTQDDRLEVEVIAWGRGEESWGIEYRIFNGSPAGQEVWDALDKFLSKSYQHESGISMNISAVCIDSGGHFTKQVYAYTKQREVRQIYSTKGASTSGKPIVSGPTMNNIDKAKVYIIGTDTAKDILYGRLRIEKEGPGYCHFPMAYDEEWFKQLTAERVIYRQGKREWDLPMGKRNEAMDIRNYALAALQILRPDWDHLELANFGDAGSSRRVYHSHSVANMVEVDVNDKLPLIVCCDFGVNPLVWLICQTDGRKAWAVDEVAQRNSNTLRMGQEVMKRYGQHPAEFVLHGSAVGAIASYGKSDYALLMDLGFRKRHVKRLNPVESDLVNALNMMLENVQGEHRFTYSPKCLMLKKDFEQAMWKEDGSGIDDTDFGRGNAARALSYFIEYNWPLKSARPNTNRRFYK